MANICNYYISIDGFEKETLIKIIELIMSHSGSFKVGGALWDGVDIRGNCKWCVDYAFDNKDDTNSITNIINSSNRKGTITCISMSEESDFMEKRIYEKGKMEIVMICGCTKGYRKRGFTNNVAQIYGLSIEDAKEYIEQMDSPWD